MKTYNTGEQVTGKLLKMLQKQDKKYVKNIGINWKKWENAKKVKNFELAEAYHQILLRVTAARISGLEQMIRLNKQANEKGKRNV